MTELNQKKLKVIYTENLATYYIFIGHSSYPGKKKKAANDWTYDVQVI